MAKSSTQKSPKTKQLTVQRLVQTIRADIAKHVKGLTGISSPSYPAKAVRVMETMNLTLEMAASCAEEGDFATTAQLLKLAGGDAYIVHKMKRDVPKTTVRVKRLNS